MQQIPLTKNYVVLVDDADYDVLARYKWTAFTPKSGQVYARRYETVNGHEVCILMHRVIMNAPPGLRVDHIDGNTLDNQRVNLRLCTQSENFWNRGAPASNTSGYKGVSRKRDKWRARIWVNMQEINIGSFATPVEAARAYDRMAVQLHGEFAQLNFLEV